MSGLTSDMVRWSLAEDPIERETSNLTLHKLSLYFVAMAILVCVFGFQMLQMSLFAWPIIVLVAVVALFSLYKSRDGVFRAPSTSIVLPTYLAVCFVCFGVIGFSVQSFLQEGTFVQAVVVDPAKDRFYNLSAAFLAFGPTIALLVFGGLALLGLRVFLEADLLRAQGLGVKNVKRSQVSSPAADTCFSGAVLIFLMALVVGLATEQEAIMGWQGHLVKLFQNATLLHWLILWIFLACMFSILRAFVSFLQDRRAWQDHLIEPCEHKFSARLSHLFARLDTQVHNSEPSTIENKNLALNLETTMNARRLLSSLINLLPLLGYLGTVLGIMLALGSIPDLGVLATGAAEREDGDNSMQSLASSLSAISLAFETTMLGLIGSLAATLSLNQLEKLENDFVVFVTRQVRFGSA